MLKIPEGNPETPRFEALHNLFKLNGIRLNKGAEIGVRLAQTAKYMLTHNPDLQLYLVDSYTPYLDLHGMISAAKQEDFKKRAIEIVSVFADRVTWIYEPSAVAHTKVEDKSLDYVFIDAAHRAESVFEDCIFWRPKIRSGGILCGHDYCHPAVQEGVKKYGAANTQKMPCEGDIFVIEA